MGRRVKWLLTFSTHHPCRAIFQLSPWPLLRVLPDAKAIQCQKEKGERTKGGKPTCNITLWMQHFWNAVGLMRHSVWWFVKWAQNKASCFLFRDPITVYHVQGCWYLQCASLFGQCISQVLGISGKAGGEECLKHKGLARKTLNSRPSISLPKCTSHRGLCVFLPITASVFMHGWCTGVIIKPHLYKVWKAGKGKVALWGLTIKPSILKELKNIH